MTLHTILLQEQVLNVISLKFHYPQSSVFTFKITLCNFFTVCRLETSLLQNERTFGPRELYLFNYIVNKILCFFRGEAGVPSDEALYRSNNPVQAIQPVTTAEVQNVQPVSGADNSGGTSAQQ